jgi:four helix bundle protein
MNASDFRELEVWKKARSLAIEVYRIASDGPLAKDFGLRDQMRRAAVSNMQQYSGR